jgi:L-fuculose-phosphate aldolase
MSYPFELESRRDMVKAARLMHVRGLISGHDGNISVRLAANKVLCTPTGVNKGFLEEKDLVIVDLSGSLVRGPVAPSSEIKMHLRVYQRRQDVRCVVHAHPPHCVACTLVGLSMETAVIPESAYLMGAVPTADYATPGTREVPDSLDPYIDDREAILLARHGSITFGRNVMEAYNRLEALEHVAQVLFLANNLGQVQPLSAEDLARLKESVTSRGIPWRYPEAGADGSGLTDLIVSRVLERLRS